MTAPIELDLDAMERIAKRATQDEWRASCRDVRGPDGSDLEAIAAWPDDEFLGCEVDGPGIPEGRGDFIGRDAAHITAFQPRVALELVRRLRAAEAMVTARIEQIPVESKMVAVFADIREEDIPQHEEFAEAIKKRCTSGRWTLVAFFPAEADIKALDAEQMRAAGWVRAEKTIPAPPSPKPAPQCTECNDDMCGGTGIYEGRKCDGIPF